MAELAGLVIGVAALGGVFKNCVDLLSCLSTGRALGSDFGLLTMKLDIERTVFLQWAEHVRLFHSNHDPRLRDKKVAVAVYNVLMSIFSLLIDSERLRKEYGMRRASIETDEEVPTVLSNSRLQAFLRQYALFQERKRQHQDSASLKQKVCWALQDKEKFESLVNEISYLVGKLNDIMPPTRHVQLMMMEQDIHSLRYPEDIKLVQQASIQNHGVMAEVAKKRLAEDAVLHAIEFQGMHDRREDVSPARHDSYSWIAESGEDASNDLADWLRSGNAIYWVNGKAGSGKSTLMKHIWESPVTREMLLSWACNANLVTACYFFWALGQPLQRSHDGLLRALLYDILVSVRSLIPLLLPVLWSQAYERADADSTAGCLAPPSVGQMRRALEILAAADIGNNKVFIILDGLDEYEGDYRETARLFQRLTSSSAIKLLVSSRPLPICIDAFSVYPNLKLEDFTHGDIETYVRSEIGSHSRMQDLQSMYPDKASRLVPDIVGKASGVFLWVVFACRTILDGFANWDSIQDLENRVNELPQELKDLFGHMLDKIDRRYREEAAKLLRLCVQSHRASGTGPLATLGLALAYDQNTDANSPLHAPGLPLGAKSAHCRELERRLPSRCWGLVEVKRLSKAELFSSKHCFCDKRNHDPLMDSEIQFLHRSVFDFLDSNDSWDLDCLQISDEEFDAGLVLSNASLILLAESLSQTMNPHRESQVEGYIRDVLLYTRSAAPGSGYFAEAVMEGLDSTMITARIEESRNQQFPILSNDPMGGILSFWASQSKHRMLLLAVETGITEFVLHYHSKYGGFPKDLDMPLLFHAFKRPNVPYSWELGSPLQMLKCLLDSGCDPNEATGVITKPQRTPWTTVLTHLESPHYGTLDECADIFTIFLAAGADPFAVSLPTLSDDQGGKDIFQVALGIFTGPTYASNNNNSTRGRTASLDRGGLLYTQLCSQISESRAEWDWVQNCSNYSFSSLPYRQNSINRRNSPPTALQPRRKNSNGNQYYDIFSSSYKSSLSRQSSTSGITSRRGSNPSRRSSFNLNSNQQQHETGSPCECTCGHDCIKRWNSINRRASVSRQDSGYYD